jgi:hypothetical protein
MAHPKKINVGKNTYLNKTILQDIHKLEKFLCGNKMPTRCNRRFLLQILLLAQHVLGTTMPIMLESIIQVVAACGIWCCKDGKCSL